VPVSRLSWIAVCPLWSLAALFLTSASSVFGDDSDIVAIYSAVSPAYARVRLPGGSFKAETYAFGEGGARAGATNDSTIDTLRFIDVARLVAPALAKKNFLPAKDPHQTDLLIMVYWGATVGTNQTSNSPMYQIAQGMIPTALPPPPPPSTGPSSPATANANAGTPGARNAAEDANSSMLTQMLMLTHLANRQRDLQDTENAKVLGYLPEITRLNEYKGTYFDAFLRQDTINDVEESRYYVVLLAYDFQTLWKTKQRKLLWETRFSIREQRNDFSKALAAMAENASRYFGQDSHGLIRQDLPATRITFGDAKVLEYEPEKSK
jgi:hypothetical protein